VSLVHALLHYFIKNIVWSYCFGGGNVTCFSFESIVAPCIDQFVG
jgi:hypothetical protein